MHCVSIHLEVYNSFQNTCRMCVAEAQKGCSAQTKVRHRQLRKRGFEVHVASQGFRTVSHQQTSFLGWLAHVWLFLSCHAGAGARADAAQGGSRAVGRFHLPAQRADDCSECLRTLRKGKWKVHPSPASHAKLLKRVNEEPADSQPCLKAWLPYFWNGMMPRNFCGIVLCAGTPPPW